MTDKPYELTSPDSKAPLALRTLEPTLGPNVLDVTSLYKERGVFTFDPGFSATAS